MLRIVLFFLSLTRYRVHLVWPIVLTTLAFLTYSVQHQPQYLAVVNLSLDGAKAQSPLLRHVVEPEHVGILKQILTSDAVLGDTLTDVNLLNETNTEEQRQQQINTFRSSLNVDVMSDRLIRLTYAAPHPTGMEQLVSGLAYNFIYELLSPERFRSDQQLANTEVQVKTVTQMLRNSEAELNQLKTSPEPTEPALRDAYLRNIATAQFNVQRFTTQLQVVQKSYEELLINAQKFDARADQTTGSDVLWFAGSPRIEEPLPPAVQHMHYILCGLLWGLFAGILMIILARLADTSIRRDDHITDVTGLRVLGRLPSFGTMTHANGDMRIGK